MPNSIKKSVTVSNSGPCPKKVGIILMTIHAWFHEPLHLNRYIFDLFTSDIVSESNLLTIFKLSNLRLLQVHGVFILGGCKVLAYENLKQLV